MRDEGLISAAEKNSAPTGGRRFAVGDVHGCSRTLRVLLGQVLRLEPADTLFLLGDYLDRGPDSKGVLDYLMTLIEDGYDLRPLMGNHEEMALKSVADPAARALWYANRGDLTVEQFSAATPQEIPRRYLEFMAGLPRMLVTGDYVFVHAGLDFSRPFPLRDTAPSFMLWEGEFRVQPEKLAGRTLVCGHTRTPLAQIRASLNDQLIRLDNGCFWKGHPGFGNLVALNLDTRELLVQENCDPAPKTLFF